MEYFDSLRPDEKLLHNRIINIEGRDNVDLSEDWVMGVQIYSTKPLPSNISFYHDPYDDRLMISRLMNEFGVIFYRDEENSRAAFYKINALPDAEPLHAYYSQFVIAREDCNWEDNNVEEGDILLFQVVNNPCHVLYLDNERVKRNWITIEGENINKPERIIEIDIEKDVEIIDNRD